MKKITFGIFAHPDDAGFGPSGTLAMAARDGSEVHLICATCGGAGVNLDGHTNLADVREQEEKRAAELIGVTSLELFRYDDGQLCNSLYLEIAGRIMDHIKKIAAPDDEVSLITFDTNGLSGHLDHILISLATTYAYLKLRGTYPTLRLKYFCLSEQTAPHPNTGWLYMPAGRPATMIDETNDVSSVHDRKLEIMHAHQTQRTDAENIISQMGEDLFQENFHYYKD